MRFMPALYTCPCGKRHFINYFIGPNSRCTCGRWLYDVLRKACR